MNILIEIYRLEHRTSLGTIIQYLLVSASIPPPDSIVQTISRVCNASQAPNTVIRPPQKCNRFRDHPSTGVCVACKDISVCCLPSLPHKNKFISLIGPNRFYLHRVPT